MKLKILFTTILLFIISCQPSSKNESTNTSKLTTSDSLKVVQEVLGVVDGYTQAHNEMNAEKAADYFLNPPEMLVLKTVSDMPIGKHWLNLSKTFTPLPHSQNSAGKKKESRFFL